MKWIIILLQDLWKEWKWSKCTIHWVCDSFDKRDCPNVSQACEVKDDGKSELKYCIRHKGRQCDWKKTNG